MAMDTGAGKVVIVSMTDSFLAKSLVTKLERVNIKADFAHAEMKELEKYAKSMELIVLFLSEEFEAAPEVLVYLKDIIQDRDIGLLMIGEEEFFDFAKKSIPEQLVTERFLRPLDIDSACRYSIRAVRNRISESFRSRARPALREFSMLPA